MVAAGTIVFRSQSIFIDELWLDDIWQRALALEPTNALESIEPDYNRNPLYSYLHLWTLRTFDNPVLIRLAYVSLFSITAVIATHQLSRVTADAFSASILITCAFLNPSTLLVFIFINGSYGVLTLFILIAVIQCLIIVFSNKHVTRASVYAQIFGSALILLMSQVSGANTLILLALPLLPWWRARLRADRRGFRFHMISTGFVVLVSFGLALETLLAKHPYTSKPGRIASGPIEVMGNFARLVGNIFHNYVDPWLSTGQPTTRIISPITTAIIILFLVGVFCSLVVRLCISTAFRDRTVVVDTVNLVDILPFLMGATALTLVGTSSIRVMHLWHPFLPSIFGIAACLVAVRLLLSRCQFVILIVIVALLGSYSFMLQNRSFGKSGRSLESISALIGGVSDSWPSNAQIFVITDPPLNAGIHLPIRRRSFLENAADRTDFEIGVIDSATQIPRILTEHVDRLDEGLRVYQVDTGAGTLTGIDIVIFGDNGQWAVNGTTGVRHSFEFDNWLCSDSVGALSFVVGLDSESSQSAVRNFRQSIGGEVQELQVKGSTKTELSVPNGNLYVLDFLLETDALTFRPEHSAYSDVSPPMPLFSPYLAIYQTPTGYQILERGSGQAVRTMDDSGITEVTFLGCEGGRAALFVDGLFQALLEPGSVSGDWFLAGYRQRVWNGHLTFAITSIGAQMSDTKAALG